jgi:hypothetical protein
MAPEAEVGAPQAGHAIDHAMTVDIPDPAALAAHDDVGWRVEHALRMRHGMHQVPGVGRFEFGGGPLLHVIAPASTLKRAAIAAILPGTSRRSK